MIEPEHPKLPIVRQCELLGVARASYYHRPEPESDANLRLMRVIDETYLAYPVFGSRQMARWLRRQGYPVSCKRVQRLKRLMGLEAIYRKSNLSRMHPSNPVFRYLLRRLVIDRPNQVWAMDITYFPIQCGFIYLCAVIDWYSRAVLAWELSNTLDAASVPGSCAGQWFSMAYPRSSTPTKAASLTRPNLPSRCWPPALSSRWTARTAAWTTSSSSGSGGRSNTTRSTSRATAPRSRPRPTSPPSPASTTSAGPTARSAGMSPRWKSTAATCRSRSALELHALISQQPNQSGGIAPLPPAPPPLS